MNPDSRAEHALAVEALADVLAQLCQTADPSHARRAIGEVRRRFGGDVAQQWWRWLAEASASLNLRALPLDARPADVQIMLDGGSAVACFVTPPGEADSVVSLLRRQGRRYQLGAESLTASQLRRRLRSATTAGLMRCVVLTADVESDDDAPPPTPLSRLRTLLQLETPDLLIVFVFALLVGVLTLATPIAVEALVNNVAFGRFLQPVLVLSLLLLSCLSFSASLRGLQTFVVELIQRRLFARVTGDVAHRLARIEHRVNDVEYLPELLNRFFDIVTVQKVTAHLLLDGVALILGTLIGMTVLAFYHPWLLGFDILLLALMGFVVLILGRGAVDSSVKESKSKYKLAAWLQDMARCTTVFKAGGNARFGVERSNRLAAEYLEARRMHFRVLFRQILFALFFQAVASTVLLGLGGWLVISGQLTLGQLVAAELIVAIIVGSFAKLGKSMESFYDLLAAVDKLGKLFDLPLERQVGVLNFGGSEGPIVRFEKTSHAWLRAAAPDGDVTFETPAGAAVVITGPAGSGKSILLDILFGLRAAESGRVTIDGMDTRDVRPDVLRRDMALVRDVEIFAGALRENIDLGSGEVSITEVRDTLRELGLLDAVLQLPKGLDTPLTSSGAPLSANQRRLLLLARALVRQPRVLAIDGVLDGLPDDDLRRAIAVLKQRENTTLLITTGRSDVGDHFAHRLTLGTPAPTGPELHQTAT